MSETYTAMQVVQRAGISYRQCDFWDKTGVVSPSVESADGSGSRRLYSAADLWRAAIAKTLVDAGLSLAKVRDVLDGACEREDVALTPRVRLRIAHKALAAQMLVEPPTGLRLVGS